MNGYTANWYTIPGFTSYEINIRTKDIRSNKHFKKDSHHRTNTIIDSNYKILDIISDSNLFLYLSKIQEEVHRFAINYHRNIKSKGLLSSYLDLVPGIGEVRRKELLKKFGSMKKMKEASVDELSKIVGDTVAINLYQVLHEEEKDENK